MFALESASCLTVVARPLPTMKSNCRKNPRLVHQIVMT
jgi:hypothetical protein